MNSFIRQFIAAIKGNTNEVEAQKAWRKAESAIRAQIAIKEGDIISLEDKVESAKEGLNSARVNGGEEIRDSVKYVTNLIKARNILTTAEYTLEENIELIKFLKEEYELLKKE